MKRKDILAHVRELAAAERNLEWEAHKADDDYAEGKHMYAGAQLRRLLSLMERGVW